MPDKLYSEWSETIPTESGVYWFYGVWRREQPPKPATRLVRVMPISNGIMYVTDGNFVSLHDIIGIWQKAIVPEPPNWKVKWEYNYLWCNTHNCSDYHRTWYEQKDDDRHTLCLRCWNKLSQVVDQYSIFPK